jgi:hypothetical protein
VPGFHITTQNDLPRSDGVDIHVLLVNQTESGNSRFLRTNVLFARPDLKKYTALRFQQDVKYHPDADSQGQDVVLVLIPRSKTAGCPAIWGSITASGSTPLWAGAHLSSDSSSCSADQPCETQQLPCSKK